MRTYKQYIFNLCDGTDFSNKEDATGLAQILAKDCIRLNEIVLQYEKKLKELMSAKDYEEWSASVSRDIFRMDIEGMADSDFKDFIKDNFKTITGEDYEVEE